jgi:tetratricopeptide (TPR) repeat protein
MLVPILDALGSVQRAQGRNADAQASYLRALTTLEKSDGERSVTLIPQFKLLAGTYAVLERGFDAERQLLRALSIREANNPSELELAGDCAELGSFYLAQKRYAVAEPNFRRAIGLVEKKLGPEDATLVPLLDNLADVFIKQKNFPPAEPPLRRIVWIQERAVGPSDVKLAPNLDKLALELFHLERFPEAEQLYRRSLAIWEPAMGPTNPDLTSAIDNLGVALAAQQKYADSEPFYKRSLALREMATVQNLNNLALVLEGSGDDANAEKQYATAIAIATKIPSLPGEKSVNEKDLLAKTLDNYSTLLRKLKRNDEAAKIEARLKALGKTTPQ